MRITSGLLRNRRFNVPQQGLRPTKEMVREAVFSALAAQIPGARVLDLFAGSGALGLEAWSRGAAGVTAVEKVSAHCQCVQQNFQSLAGDSDLGDWKVVQADAFDFLQCGAGSFDLIFADPPYDNADLPRLLEAVAGRLASGGVLVFEMRSRGKADVPADWEVLKEKKYGETRLLFLAPAEENA